MRRSLRRAARGRPSTPRSSRALARNMLRHAFAGTSGAGQAELNVAQSSRQRVRSMGVPSAQRSPLGGIVVDVVVDGDTAVLLVLVELAVLVVLDVEVVGCVL